MVEVIISLSYYGRLHIMPLNIGSYLNNRYRVKNRIGHGGMAEVYEAYDVISKKPVAIKLIREELMNNPANLQRFANEATIAASLNHENIVRIFNHGAYNGIPYMVIEYVEGQTLSEKLNFRSYLELAETLDIMIQLTSALECAHEHNVIHRDVKPQNIFSLHDGTIKLGDFGIAELSGLKSKEGNGNEIVGSVHYMAPEIVRGNVATPQSDIYSAGVTFFELLTGRLPFNSTDAVSVAVCHVKEKFPSVNKFLPACPKQIDNIIKKATSKDLEYRYHTASEFKNDLINLKEHPELLKEKKSWISRLFGFK